MAVIEAHETATIGGVNQTPFARALAAIDEANSHDPRTIDVAGRAVPWEVAHAEALTSWVRQLLPEPSDAVLLAARGQHIRRWTHPRSAFPEGRTGYLRWRTTLYGFHAAECRGILEAAGLPAATVDRVAQLVAKQCPAGDIEAQAIEDGLCLVFLEQQLPDVAVRVDGETLTDVIRKTWRKMSPQGRAAALALPFPPAERELIELALGPG